MGKLSKAELKAHNHAVELVNNGRALSVDERQFIVENWHPGAVSDCTSAGAFFTPSDLAHDFGVVEVPSWGTVVDLCAGIGGLAFFATRQHYRTEDSSQYKRIICVERNPAFVEIGRRVMPEAHWICGDVLNPDVWAEIGEVDFAFCNPPFGRMMQSDFKAPRYSGAEADLKVLDVAMMLAPMGAAIIPAQSAPFSFVGGFNRRPSRKFDAFHRCVGVSLDGSSVDATYHRDNWRDVCPDVVVATWDVEAYGDQPCAIPSDDKQLALSL
jgi:predicted RNA methylase